MMDISSLVMKKQAQKLAEIFSIFSNEKRILIFWILNGREMSVNDIAETIGASVQNTSQHLRLMKDRNTLETRRDGHTIYYRISDSVVGRYCQIIHQVNLEEYAE
jgi:ArsR family transcriptional regulator